MIGIIGRCYCIPAMDVGGRTEQTVIMDFGLSSFDLAFHDKGLAFPLILHAGRSITLAQLRNTLV